MGLPHECQSKSARVRGKESWSDKESHMAVVSHLEELIDIRNATRLSK